MGLFSIVGTIIVIVIVIVAIVVNDGYEFKPFRESTYTAGYGIHDAPVVEY